MTGSGFLKKLLGGRRTEEEKFVGRFMDADPADRESVVSEFAGELLSTIHSNEAREAVLLRLEQALRKEAVRHEIINKKKRDIVKRLMRAFDPEDVR